MRNLTLVAAAFAVFGSTCVQAADISVTRFDDPAPTGCTPTNCSLREAVILANAFSDADRIVLAPGTYELSIIANDDDSQGGDLDITNDLTIVGAGSAQTAIHWFLPVDRIFHVLGQFSDPGLHVKIAGMTLRGGGAPTGGAGSHDGGGIQALGSHLDIQLTDVVFDNNIADAGYGGAAQIFGERVTLDLVRATHNRALYGGGVRVGVYSGDALSILGLTLDGNHAQSCGGGMILLIDNSGLQPIDVRELVVQGNFADGDGAGLCAGAYRRGMSLRNAVFDSNVAGNSGSGGAGGLLIVPVTLDASSEFGTALAIRSSTFTGNRAKGNGGAISFGDEAYGSTGDCDLTIESSTIADNEASDSLGGGIYLHPVLSPTPCRFVLVSSRVDDNVAKQGGGIYSAMDATTITKSTLVNNTATYIGGALEVHDAIALVSSSTFAYNDGGQYGGAIEIFSDLLSIASSTFYRNTAPLGPTLDNNHSRTLFVADTTLVASGTTGSVYYNTPPVGTPHFDNSILAGSCANDSPIGLHNLASTFSNCPFTEVPDANFMFGPLADNGGPTETVLPSGSNTAIGYVPAMYCTNFDQRGFLRSAPCDVGAVETDGINDLIFADAFDDVLRGREPWVLQERDEARADRSAVDHAHLSLFGSRFEGGEYRAGHRGPRCIGLSAALIRARDAKYPEKYADCGNRRAETDSIKSAHTATHLPCKYAPARGYQR